MEINQLNETVTELELKQSNVKTEIKVFKRQNDQLRESLKVFFKIVYLRHITSQQNDWKKSILDLTNVMESEQVLSACAIL